MLCIMDKYASTGAPLHNGQWEQGIHIPQLGPKTRTYSLKRRNPRAKKTHPKRPPFKKLTLNYIHLHAPSSCFINTDNVPPKLLICVETNISINSIIKQRHTHNQDTLHAGYVSAVFLSPFRHQHDPAIGSYVVF